MKKRKNDLLYTILALAVCFASYSQRNSSFNLKMRLESKPVLMETYHLEATSLFWNRGFKARAILKDNFVFGLGVSHSNRTYEDSNDDVVFCTNLPSQPLSTLIYHCS